MTDLRFKASILVVEDEPALRGLICRGLAGAGYQVTDASDGNRAVELLERTPFDVVLTDIIMPGREGIETIIEIRKRWPGTKIVAMSGGGRIEPSTFLDMAKGFGADAVLKKPFKQSSLLETLADLHRDCATSPQDAPVKTMPEIGIE